MGEASDHTRLFEEFDRLCDLPAKQRDQALTQLRASEPSLVVEIEKLLAEDSEAGRDVSPLTAAVWQAADGVLERDRVGEQIGRFVLLKRIGQGGMGVVYAAFDNELDRRVAIKLIRSGTPDPRERARLQREARAMAKLTHPNVVTVYEAGTVGDEVFVAMEHIQGPTLRAWVGDERRPWREVLAMYTAAARGLAAAHCAGLVHRDFKPDNVIVGDDGRPRVLDFGLARPGDTDRRLVLEEEEENVTENVTGTPQTAVTKTGAVLGTPAYMAPEQFAGRFVDHRTDQFAFCVALWEGLFGERPFSGSTFMELYTSVIRGTLRKPASTGSVPSWLIAVLTRGLATESAQRYADMDALLAALAADPAILRRRGLRIAVVVGALSLGAGGVWFGLADEVNCEAARAETRALWSGETRASVVAQYGAIGVPFASGVLERALPQLDVYVAELADSRVDACQAYADGQLSPRLFDRRVACLDHRQASLEATIELLQGAGSTTVEKTPDMIEALPGLARCRDHEALVAQLPPPEDQEAATRVQAARQQLVRAEAFMVAGKYDETQTTLQGVAASSRELAYPPLEAELALLEGAIERELMNGEEAAQALNRALTTALTVDHIEVSIDALAQLLFVRGELLNQAKAALDDRLFIEAMARRRPEDRKLGWLVANNIAVLLDRNGEYEQAVERYQDAIALFEEDGLVVHKLAQTYLNLCYLHGNYGHHGRALDAARRAWEIAETVLGPRHPEMLHYAFGLGNALFLAGRTQQAAALVDDQLARPEVQARTDVLVPLLLRLQAGVALQARAYETADARASRALERLHKLGAAGDYYRIMPLQIRFDAQVGMGRLEQGHALYREAIALANNLELTEAMRLPVTLHYARALMRKGHDSQAREVLTGVLERARGNAEKAPELLVGTLVTLGTLHRREGGPGRGEVLLREAVIFGDSKLTQHHSDLARARTELAEVLLARGDTEEAASLLHRASLAYEATHDVEHPDYALARFALARALIGLPETAPYGRDPMQLAHSAREALAGYGDGFAVELRELDTWISEETFP